MIRNIKVLGLSLVAMLALGVAVASGASAAEFHSSAAGETTLKGTSTSNHVFDAAGSTITCTGAEFNGIQKGETAPAVTMNAKYTGCSVSILGFKINATVEMNGCAYEFNANGNVGVVNNTSGGNCATSPITYRVSNFLGECDVKVGPQSGLSGVTYTGTSPSEETIKVASNVSAISGTATGGLCPETGAFTNGRYTEGSATVTGNGGAAQIWVTH